MGDLNPSDAFRDTRHGAFVQSESKLAKDAKGKSKKDCADLARKALNTLKDQDKNEKKGLAVLARNLPEKKPSSGDLKKKKSKVNGMKEKLAKNLGQLQKLKRKVFKADNDNKKKFNKKKKQIKKD